MTKAAQPRPGDTRHDEADQRTRPRLAILSFSSGEFDARSARVARSAVRAGFEVVVYARLQHGLPPIEQREGYRVVRAPANWWLAVPVLRTLRRRRHPGFAALATATPEPPRSGQQGRRLTPTPTARILSAMGRVGDAIRAILMFPVRPLAWSYTLADVVQPADLWHGMWAGSLPALTTHSRRLGGRTIYDSRDVYMHSRLFAATFRPLQAVLARIERRWARRVDRVITVNEPYAELIAKQLGVPRPPVVMNCPDAWTPGDRPPDLIRAALNLPADTPIALYQGQLITDRGIEQAMDAIVDVPGAVLALLGFGSLQAELEERSRRPPWAGRVFVLPAVPPEELLLWTASADVSVMPIQPTSLNHRHTTPQKLFESLAAGVPVVASDLPGMAAVVRATGAGALVDPTSPASIAAGIRSVLNAPPAERAALRVRVLAAAHAHYTWEAQVGTLLALYRELLGEESPVAPA
jgi:glycogen synthase